jgi:AraC-like DNA-binding protein
MDIIKTRPQYLTDYIECFYSVHASASDSTEIIHRRLPDGTLDIVFNLGAPVLLSRDGVHFTEMPAVALTGLYQDRKFIQYKGEVHLTGVVFRAGFAHLFVHDTLTQYEECALDGALIFGSEICLLAEQLKCVPDDREQHRLLEGFLMGRLTRKVDCRSSLKISAVVQQIHACNGHVAMSALYKDHFMSERTFRRNFGECVGMNPKQYANIVRIKAFNRHYHSSRTSYAGICTELGYTDQSHFIKDFQKIVGLAPTAYFNQLTNISTAFIHLI